MTYNETSAIVRWIRCGASLSELLELIEGINISIPELLNLIEQYKIIKDAD